MLKPILIAMVVAASAQLVVAADVQESIKDLSSPNVMTRCNACQALGTVGTKDQAAAVDALVGALGDVSGSVRLAAAMAIGRVGPAAKKAVPKLIECYQRDTVNKGTIIRTLGAVGPDLPEAIDFVVDVVRGGKGATRPLATAKPPIALRREAIETLGKVGPRAKSGIPVLLDVLNMSANDIAHHELEFRLSADSLSLVGVGDKRVSAALKRFQQGKGFRAKGKGREALERSVVVADTAAKRLERAESSADEKKKDKK